MNIENLTKYDCKELVNTTNLKKNDEFEQENNVTAGTEHDEIKLDMEVKQQTQMADESKENYAETSVIRMATTCQKQQQQQQHMEESIEKCVAEDLSQQNKGIDIKNDMDEQKIPPTTITTQAVAVTASNLHKKGPKKLIIKPKSAKTEQKITTKLITTTTTTCIADDDDEKPTTSAAAAAQIFNLQQQIDSALKLDLESIVKHETAIDKEDKPQQNIVMECKPEETKLQKKFVEYTTDLKLETERNSALTEDARMLYEFAHSKKHKAAAAAAAAQQNVSTDGSFLSTLSIFSKVNNDNNNDCTRIAGTRSPTNNCLRCDDEFIPADVNETDCNQTHNYSTNVQNNNAEQQHADRETLNTFIQQPHHTFADYPFSFLYGANAHGQSHGNEEMPRFGNFSPALYQHPTNDGGGTTAATLASGSNSLAASLDDSCSTHQQQQQQQNFNANHWYQQQTVANADFETALAVDCNNAVLNLPDTEGNKYLDLDGFCKRESSSSYAATNHPIVVASSATSSSFAAATDSSLAGGDALNIRTDEKMPAKGEISEQESNCDIENSWSQPMYGDFPGRYFKNSFPSMFQQDNGWHQDEYFAVQDLSAATNNLNVNNSNNKINQKNFDFRLPFEASTSTAPVNLQLFSQHNSNNNKLHIVDDGNVPSTSTATKKKRKRATTTATVKRTKPTATVTSQQLLLQQQLEQPVQAPFNMQLTQDAVTLLAGPSTTTAAASAMQQAQHSRSVNKRKKVYSCSSCNMQFNKLKERNSHLIVMHNYVRQNRRLICNSILDASSTSAEVMSEIMAAANAQAAAASAASTQVLGPEFTEDSKQGIVKLEVSELQTFAQRTTTELTQSLVGKNGIEVTSELLATKTEFSEEKGLISLVQVKSEEAAALSHKKLKARILPLAATTPANKLATLYRMLVSFNMATLRRSQNLSECDQKLMESSIFFCYVCRTNFNTVKLYDAHLAEHPAECFTCGKKFQRWKNFSLHLKRHLGWKEFGCNVCEKKFVVRSALIEHMRMHTGHTPLKCKICGKNFKRYSNLTQHRKRHVRQIVRKKEYVCHCGEVLPSKARFLWHKETHDAKPKCCPYCCDRFVHANSLRRHIRLAHSDKFDYTEPMECPMCKQIFAKSSIKAHMATHSMDTQYNCAICNKSFSTKWNLKIHNWVHANRTAKPFKCEHCPKAFVREIDFKNHINAHKQIKPYTCEFCGCKFIRKYNYMRHRREHHGSKKYTCDLCKKSFHRHYYLIEHRRIHTGERPFTCTICGKSSTTKTNHNKHLKIHHSRDPFTVEA